VRELAGRSLVFISGFGCNHRHNSRVKLVMAYSCLFFGFGGEGAFFEYRRFASVDDGKFASGELNQ